uniref:Putative ubiquitin protein ligase n=1 Tax=Ixodes ricinus TaxID=34613 RepID=A0A0K8RLW4_IXORI
MPRHSQGQLESCPDHFQSSAVHMFSTHRLQPSGPTGGQHCHSVHAAARGARPHCPALDKALCHISLANQLVVAMTLIIAVYTPPSLPPPPPPLF